MAGMDAGWLKEQFRINPERTRAELASALGLGASAVSKMLAGTRQIKAAEYIRMRRFFGLPVDGERAARRGVTGRNKAEGLSHYVLDPIRAGARNFRDGGSADDEGAWMIPAGILKGHTRTPPDKIRTFAVTDNAMAPDFSAGERVLVDLSDTQPSPPGTFLVSDGLTQMLRHCEYVAHSKPPSVTISTVSGRSKSYTVSLAKAGIIGRVIARLEWL